MRPLSEKQVKRMRIGGTQLVFALLRQGRRVTNLDILRESYRLRGKGLVVNSRIADARALAENEGWTIRCRPLNVVDGVYEYWREELTPAITADTWREVMEGAAA